MLADRHSDTVITVICLPYRLQSNSNNWAAYVCGYDAVCSMQRGVRQQRGRGELDRRGRCDSGRRTNIHQELTAGEDDRSALQSHRTGHHTH